MSTHAYSPSLKTWLLIIRVTNSRRFTRSIELLLRNAFTVFASTSFPVLKHVEP